MPSDFEARIAYFNYTLPGDVVAMDLETYFGWKIKKTDWVDSRKWLYLVLRCTEGFQHLYAFSKSLYLLLELLEQYG